MGSDILSKPFNAYYEFYSRQTQKTNKGIGTYILIFFLFIFYLALAVIHITFLIITVGQLVDINSAVRAVKVMFGGKYEERAEEIVGGELGRGQSGSPTPQAAGTSRPGYDGL